MGSSFLHPAATNVMWTLKLRCQDSCQGFGFLVPTARLGRNLRPGKPWSRSVWMGTFGLGWAPLQSPALVGEDAGGFAVSHLDLGCHLVAGASPGWGGCSGTRTPRGLWPAPAPGDRLGWENTGKSRGHGLWALTCTCLSAPPHPAPDANGLLQIKSSPLNPQKRAPAVPPGSTATA